MTTTIAFANQKGGVGKTTSAVSVASEFGFRGRRVLLLDMDPQGSASSGLRVDFPPEGEDLYDVFFGRRTLSEVVYQSGVQNVWVAPASRDLISLEIEIGKKTGRELILKTELALLRSRFDYVLIDCPPSSGLLTLNALGAADKVTIPLQAEYYALEGLSALMNTIEFVRQTFNPQLELLGVFMTMFDVRTNLSVQVEAEAKSYFKDSLFKVRIPRNIKLSECPSHGLSIRQYDVQSAGAKAYAELADAMLERIEGAVMSMAVNE